MRYLHRLIGLTGGGLLLCSAAMAADTPGQSAADNPAETPAGSPPDSLADSPPGPRWIEPDAGRLDLGLGWEFCGPRPSRLGPAPAPDLPTPTTPIDFEAGGISYLLDSEVIEATGGVNVARAGQRVEAYRARFDRINGDLATFGTTFLEYPGVRILGQDAQLNLASDTGRINDARYRFSGTTNLRGHADVAYVDNPQRSRYDNISYTSCPPGSNAWSLQAKELTLDQETGRGIARNARLRIRGVPVLYTPYLDFPIDDRRKSGFLVPSIGSSEKNGFELTTPYYWNIAPNMDATLSPRYMSRRGLMLGGEFRWLSRRDSGTVAAEFMPNDQLYDEGDTRGAFSINQQGRFFERWITNLDYSQVSDNEYLQDLGNTIDTTSNRRLLQSGSATYVGNGWSFLTRVEAYQTIDPGVAPEARPYGRLPQLLLTLSPRRFGPGLVGGAEVEYSHFDHNHRVYGERFAFSPNLSWPLRRSYGHLIPSVNLHLTEYALTDEAAGQPSDPGHAIPSFDIDGKLVFERQLDWLGQPALQTLEPRLYYLYTPYADQDDAPVFDSSELNFNFSNLFRSNRFTGRDRIGDANQITAALTSRTLLSSTGDELLRLSLGQIFYFADRRVQISGDTETSDRSPYTGELSARLSEQWAGRASFEWDPEKDEEQWQRRTLTLEYRHPNSGLLNLSYRADETAAEANRYEDTDLSFRLPFGARAEVVGRWLYSLRHDETMDAFAGVEFGECCWRVRVLGRKLKRQPDEDASSSVMVQFELAGLSTIGNPIGKFLEREIYGYQTD
ncbi:LPS assembly protein LptD [Thiohalocapsa marina]|uniref:LPS-assembly protein LptD n=1 Tax=Thiohalocapsa marina TaxID=424902 RepID=A0A5M8FAX2_9GAMM|nr:LPS assembly protein LptD [Thiohalocapsa marina]KAA6181877.1 LPS assembly protein LptD [Thiohalocapsa marina]